MRHVQDNAEEQVRRVIDVLEDGAFAYEMDDGAVDRAWPIRIDPQSRSATIDFAGTSPQQREQLQRARRRSPRPPCSMSSARWSTTTSRSTPAA